MMTLCVLEAAFVFVGGLCWGSFLNMLAHRILYCKSVFTLRSHCPHCHGIIAWYDNIPLLSWLLLRGKCRNCSGSISKLYPFIELISGLIFAFLFYKFCSITLLMHQPDIVWWDALEPINPLDEFMIHDLYSFLAYLPFVSALIAATRTDLEAMVIPQLFTLWLVPLGVVCAFAGLLEITVKESILGAILGYGVLWAIAWVFKKATGKDGMGEGDMELLALIGSFLGPIGAWMSLLVGSISGLFLGAAYVFLWEKNRAARIPFGPFLSFGAILYLLYAHVLMKILFF